MQVSVQTTGGTVYLAGEPGVNERVHTSASDIVLTGKVNVQVQQFLRGAQGRVLDRGGLTNTLTFGTARIFDTTAEAETWILTYDTTTPRYGVIYCTTYAPGGAPVTIALGTGVVQPPERKVIGCTVLLRYTIEIGKSS